jgi:HAD superfamily hydrolase (TIGR01509 family)
VTGASQVGATTAHHSVRGVVFDCDGVLANTTPCWEDAFSGVAREFGLPLRAGRLTALRGAAIATAARRMAGWSSRSIASEDVAEALHERLAKAIEDSDLVLIEGARDLLEELHGIVCLGVASNSPRSVLLRVMARLDITGYFAAAISADDVERPKPAPDPYLAACQALLVDPRLSFAIEDSQIGVRSATAAGLAVIELTDAPPHGPDRERGTLRVRSLTDRRIRQLILGPATAPTYSRGPGNRVRKDVP